MGILTRRTRLRQRRRRHFGVPAETHNDDTFIVVPDTSWDSDSSSDSSSGSDWSGGDSGGSDFSGGGGDFGGGGDSGSW